MIFSNNYFVFFSIFALSFGLIQGIIYSGTVYYNSTTKTYSFKTGIDKQGLSSFILCSFFQM